MRNQRDESILVEGLAGNPVQETVGEQNTVAMNYGPDEDLFLILYQQFKFWWLKDTLPPKE